MSSRKEEKEALRDERQQREQATQEAARRRRRVLGLGAAAAAAVLVLVVAIAISQSGSDDGGSGSTAGETAEVERQFAGIEQKRSLLGEPDAPVTLIEYADLQCPFCAQYATDVLPTVLKDYVRMGKLKLDLRLLTFIGPDSQRGAEVAAAASLQNRMWEFTDLFYRQQGEENSGYVTDGFLEEIADATPGLDADEAIDQADSERVQGIVAVWADEAQQSSVSGTPTFFLQRPGLGPQQLQVESLEAGVFTDALDSALDDL